MDKHIDYGAASDFLQIFAGQSAEDIKSRIRGANLNKSERKTLEIMVAILQGRETNETIYKSDLESLSERLTDVAVGSHPEAAATDKKIGKWFKSFGRMSGGLTMSKSVLAENIATIRPKAAKDLNREAEQVNLESELEIATLKCDIALSGADLMKPIFGNLKKEIKYLTEHRLKLEPHYASSRITEIKATIAFLDLMKGVVKSDLTENIIKALDLKEENAANPFDQMNDGAFYKGMLENVDPQIARKAIETIIASSENSPPAEARGELTERQVLEMQLAEEKGDHLKVLISWTTGQIKTLPETLAEYASIPKPELRALAMDKLDAIYQQTANQRKQRTQWENTACRDFGRQLKTHCQQIQDRHTSLILDAYNFEPKNREEVEKLWDQINTALGVTDDDIKRTEINELEMPKQKTAARHQELRGDKGPLVTLYVNLQKNLKLIDQGVNPELGSSSSSGSQA